MIVKVNHDQLRRILVVLQCANIPACIIGPVGCGKTTVVEDFVKDIDEKIKGFNLWKVFLGLIDPTEIGGIPVRVDNGDSVKIKYAPSPILPFNTDEAGIILGDEYDRSSPEVQNAFNQILLGREIHGNKISDNAFVVLTMNGATDRYTTQLSNAARTRVCTLFLDADDSQGQWDRWAAKNNINPKIRGFASIDSKELVNDSEKDLRELAMYTPRTRDMVGSILTAVENVSVKTDDILLPMIAGLVGVDTAHRMLSYFDNYDKLSIPKDILYSSDEYIVDDEILKHNSNGHMFGTFISAMLSKAVNDEGADHMKVGIKALNILAQLPDEIAMWTIREAVEIVPELLTTKEYQDISKRF